MKHGAVLAATAGLILVLCYKQNAMPEKPQSDPVLMRFRTAVTEKL